MISLGYPKEYPQNMLSSLRFRYSFCYAYARNILGYPNTSTGISIAYSWNIRVLDKGSRALMFRHKVGRQVDVKRQKVGSKISKVVTKTRSKKCDKK